jgi:uncharacterized protein (DUF58 family)
LDKRELLRKISSFHLVSRDLAEDLAAGDFASVFRGQGMEFDEIRRYEPGDDVRIIDWNVTARFGEAHVKMYREERELSLCIVLDCSFSMRTGGGRQRAGETQPDGRFAAAGSRGADERDGAAQDGGTPERYGQAVLAAALLAFSAERSGQRVGAIFFDADITRVYSPRRGRAHIMTVLNAALDGEPAARGSGLDRALAGTARILAGRRFRRGAPRCLVAVISDFMAQGWERGLADLAARHDVIAIRIADPVDMEAPRTGLLAMRDRETGQSMQVLPRSGAFRQSWSAWHEDRAKRWAELCRRAGASALVISTADDAAAELARYFRSAAKRRRERRHG